jgi:inosine/xanthosine triphosphate pyrophosphatase family protein
VLRAGDAVSMKFFLASSNPGKLREYRALASDAGVELEAMPNFRDVEAFQESAPTFAENAAG